MKRPVLGALAAMMLLPTSALARNYSAHFDGDNAKAALAILKKATGYDFVYQKDLLKDKGGKVIGNYKDVTLEHLLDYTIGMQLGLSYTVTDKTITLSPGKPGAPGDLKDIRGVVVDNEGEPLPGATVSIKGTNLGMAANLDGEFSLPVPGDGNGEIEVRYVGMNPVNLKITKQMAGKPVRIVMQPNESVMSEVVVTGYQNIKKESATGAYTVISKDDLAKRTSTNLVSNLEGRIPGVVIERSSQKSGEDLMKVRGQGTFEARTAPLVVVDGLPIEGGMNTINPYEVESVTVLKDASAAAIYGARAANGVIVVTTKSAKKEKISVDFNADVTMTEKIDYRKAGLTNAAQTIWLERQNWNAMLNDPLGESALNSMIGDWQQGGYRAQGLSQVERLLVRNHLGEISDAELNSTLDAWGKRDYRREWQDALQRTQVNQLYNLAVRTQGKTVNSNLVFNYQDDNTGMRGGYDRTVQFRYKGDIKATDWLDFNVSVNVISQREKSHSTDEFGNWNGFAPYESMYDADGSLRDMEAGCILSNPALSVPEYELKDHSYNLIKDYWQNTDKKSYTNIRAYLHANVKLPVKGWTAQAQFQYEDIKSSTEYYNSKDSYRMRSIYNLYTTVDHKEIWVDDPDFDIDNWDWDFDHYGKKPVNMPVTTHHVPDGGMLQTYENKGSYYTFRVQTNYNNTFLDRHEVNALVGFEYRDVHSHYSQNTRVGYDPQTLTNQIVKTDWDFINGWGNASILGPEYMANGIYGTFGDGDTLHRYLSYYMTANYVYDSRYSIFGSWRLDKTDLFGSDPKFRGRPLWSIGLSWNIHNENFMHDVTAVNFLKLRGSYGYTGNIDPDATSYLTAEIKSNGLNGNWVGTVQTPPNDQLRWEKTQTWNVGVDFSLFDYRLNGSIDVYRKNGTDLLTDVALDATTGVPGAKQKLNAGCMVNKGFEIALQGRILPQTSRRDLGINLSANFSYNKNKVTKVYFHPITGYDFRTKSLLEGYPLNPVVSIDYAGLQQAEGDNMIYGTWRDHEGNIHNTALSSAELEIADCIFSGTGTPVWTGGFSPEFKWQGFTLSGMFAFYGGHVRRFDPTYCNTIWGYGASTPLAALDYWNGVEGALPNGYLSKYVKNGGTGASDFRRVERADYLKFRNLMLTYEFERKLIRHIGLNELSLRFQINNLCTWARNSYGWDPEGMTVSCGIPMRQPRSYALSLYFNL